MLSGDGGCGSHFAAWWGCGEPSCRCMQVAAGMTGLMVGSGSGLGLGWGWRWRCRQSCGVQADAAGRWHLGSLCCVLGVGIGLRMEMWVGVGGGLGWGVRVYEWV